jgi:hypothetical protein
MSGTLKTLILVECQLSDTQVPPNVVEASPHAQSHPRLALQYLVLKLLDDDTIALRMLPWLASSATQSTLRTMSVPVTFPNEGILIAVCSFINHPSCGLEQLEMVLFNLSDHWSIPGVFSAYKRT